MDAATATAILAEAKSSNVFKQDMPEDDARRVDEAQKLVRQAEAAEKAGARGAVVQAILAIARGETKEVADGNANGSAQAPEAGGAPAAAPEDREGAGQRGDGEDAVRTDD